MVVSLDNVRAYNRNKMREWRAANRDRDLSQRRAWYAKNRERVLAYSKEYEHTHREERTMYTRTRRYGITKVEFDTKWLEQAGQCAICGTKLVRFGVSSEKCRAHLDHNHKTQAHRGLLCRNCNTGLGMFSDSPETLRKAVEYLNRFK